MSATQITMLDLAAIQASSTNPRKNFDSAALAELADSIRSKGILQPVLVRPLPVDRITAKDPPLCIRRPRSSTLWRERTGAPWLAGRNRNRSRRSEQTGRLKNRPSRFRSLQPLRRRPKPLASVLLPTGLLAACRSWQRPATSPRHARSPASAAPRSTIGATTTRTSPRPSPRPSTRLVTVSSWKPAGERRTASASRSSVRAVPGSVRSRWARSRSIATP